MRKPSSKWLLLALGTLAGCSDDPAEPLAGDRNLASAQVLVGPDSVKGEIGPGALYALYLPAEWNGDLVLYAQGWGPNTGTVALPGGAGLYAFRDGLLARGYAVAWTSRSEGGMALQDGVTRTRQLHALFTASFARPEHTYLYGTSLGAAVAMELAETSAGKFDGVLTESGIVGGLPHQLNYYFTVRALFDWYFPGVLPGDAVTIPEGQLPGQYSAAVAAAINGNPVHAAELAAVDQVELQYNTPAELVSAIAMPLNFNTNILFVGDILARTNGQKFFDNRDVTYTGSEDDAALNAGIARYAAHPAAMNEIARMYSPNGRLTLPVFTINCLRDPVVPVSHAAALAAKVAEAGASDLLFQWTPACATHGIASTTQKLDALDALAAWAETGMRPTGW